jgi:translation initiation factor 5B
LRSRGSSLCDIAILVVDITAQKLEQQTLESINLLKMRKTPFVVALNKIDRMYGWKPNANAPVQETLKKQDKSAVAEFDDKVKNVVMFLAEQGLNATLYYKNKDFRKYVSIVPTSAVTGEGIPDLIMLLVQLTQRLMMEKLLSLSKLQCTVLEVSILFLHIY